MRNFIATFFCMLLSFSLFGQATSLTVDCQTPGWLSSKINYGDQVTVENLTVTGYINKVDLEFIEKLNKSYNLTGEINIRDAEIVENNHRLYLYFLSNGKHIRKFVHSNTELMPSHMEAIADTVVWTNIDSEEIVYLHDIGEKAEYIEIEEGVRKISSNSKCPKKLNFPSSLTEIHHINNCVIYSFIEDPSTVNATDEDGYSTGQYHTFYYGAIGNSTIYIPKGTMEKYLNSDFTKDVKAYDSYSKVPCNNTFIEYYDIENTTLSKNEVYMYIGDTYQLDVDVLPDLNLVSHIDYQSSDNDVASVTPNGVISAKKYGIAEISATPIVFIKGLETKTGVCSCNVVAHTEGVAIPENAVINIGEKKLISASTIPYGITDNKVSYSCDNSEVATIDEFGYVTGIKSGKCNVTAISLDGGFTAICEVIVKEPVNDVNLLNYDISLVIGENYSLRYVITPSNAENITLTWSSDDESVATVDSQGLVTAVSSGKTKIWATSNDNPEANDYCEITVLQPVTGVELDVAEYNFSSIGQTKQLVVSVLPANAENKAVTWESSNPTVCNVTSTGLVTALGIGSCVVIVTTADGSLTAQCSFTVSQPVSSISLTTHEVVLGIGEKTTLTYEITPANAADKSVSWTSEDPDVATVDDQGVVTAVASGTTKVYATSNADEAISDYCTITVPNPVTGISLDLSLYEFTSIGQTLQLTATIAPSDATNTLVRWSSSNQAVCTVNDGMVTATGYGSSVVVATADEGGFMAFCIITVKETNMEVSTDLTKFDDVAFIQEKDVAAVYHNIMSIQLNNTAAIKGFSFTMELPTGFAFATDEDDFPLADLSIERTTLRRTDHFTADYLNDEQHLEVSCSSSRNYAFSGNSGEICTIVIDVAEDKPLGTYPLVLRNLILTLTDGTEKQVGDIVTCINLVKFYPGDTNLDTYVDADDITYLAKVVVGLEEETISCNQDVNPAITVSDIPALVKLINGGE